ncbi:UbiA prenyltransferase family [Cyathus striatus]|nr:UbiA prenyltransferase family [Cyathus striatus]KAF8994223.1 UbiA prenyltransferase family [Cyathus striatus]
MYREQLNRYMRLCRLHQFPIGSSLSFVPCAWGLAMAAYAADLPAQSLIVHTLVFAFASITFHSAACVLNDICDIEFDKKVERTKNRPLVTGAVSTKEAWFLLSTLILLWIPTIISADSAVIWPGCIFHAIYPLAKRWTWWPQLLLGLAMNWGYIIAWLSVMPFDPTVVPCIYIGCICWTMIYDTIYACQDRNDDRKAGIKSTAILFGESVKLIVSIFYIVFIICFATAGVYNSHGK